MSILKLDDEKPPRVKAGLAKSKTPRSPRRSGARSPKRPAPGLGLERSDLRAHYENVAARALSSIGRDWRLIASLVALALALASAVMPLIPRRYSATALVYPNLFTGEQGKLTPMGSIDAASLVGSEARLIVSDAVLQAVVKRLELDRKPGTVEPRPWMSAAEDWLRAMVFPETRNFSPFDRQVALLRNRVDVMKDARSYLISISFTARSADEAAAVVNAIALEYVRDKKMLRAQSAVAAAEGELQRQLAINGERHPKVLQSADGLESARAGLQAVMTAEGGNQSALMADDGGVKLAIPNRTPTSPKGIVVLGMSFIVSLLAGIGLAVWRDRPGVEPRRFPFGLVPSGSRSGRHVVTASTGRGASFGMPLLRRFRVGLGSLVRRAREILHLGSRWMGDRWHRLRTGTASLALRAHESAHLGGRWIKGWRRQKEIRPAVSPPRAEA